MSCPSACSLACCSPCSWLTARSCSVPDSPAEGRPNDRLGPTDQVTEAEIKPRLFAPGAAELPDPATTNVWSKRKTRCDMGVQQHGPPDGGLQQLTCFLALLSDRSARADSR
ncbi:hypothetical protein LIA77_02190 [Sarocladium implicatum]|nr:hypothetical protein LIA77_02190 [Sarocladium implicatum]